MSPSPSVSASVSPSAMSYVVVNQWSGNFQGNVTVRNAGQRLGGDLDGPRGPLPVRPEVA
jgi:hypothetical protein